MDFFSVFKCVCDKSSICLLCKVLTVIVVAVVFLGIGYAMGKRKKGRNEVE